MDSKIREEIARLAVEIENASRYIDGLKTNENIPDDEQEALVSSLTRSAKRIRALLPLLQRSYQAGQEAMRERAAGVEPLRVTKLMVDEFRIDQAQGRSLESSIQRAINVGTLVKSEAIRSLPLSDKE